MRRPPLVVCLVALLSVAVNTQAPAPEDLVKQGRTLVSQGKLDEAITRYRQAIRLSPQAFDARLALGIALDLQGQYAEARTHLNEAIRRAPAGARNQALNAMAISFAFESRPTDALKYLEPVYTQQLADQDLGAAAATANAIGRMYLETGDIANARRWYDNGGQCGKKITGLPAADQDLWELRWLHAQARIAARENKADEARKHVAQFEQVMQRRAKLADDNEIYRYLLGYVGFYLKDYDRAINELAKANLADPFIANLLGMAYEAKGDMNNARQYYRRTLEINAHSLPNAFARPHARSKVQAGSG